MLIVKLLDNSFVPYLIQNVNLGSQLQLDAETYELSFLTQPGGDFLGFYDWLCRSDGSIAGVQMNILESKYFDFLTSFSYTNATPGLFSLYFNDSEDLSIIPSQDFGDNYLYRSELGSYLFTFSTDSLSNLEFCALQQHCLLVEQNSQGSLVCVDSFGSGTSV